MYTFLPYLKRKITVRPRIIMYAPFDNNDSWHWLQHLVAENQYGSISMDRLADDRT